MSNSRKNKMTDIDVGLRLREIFEDWLKAKIVQRGKEDPNIYSDGPSYTIAVNELSEKWDELLDSLGVRKINNFPDQGSVRISDPFHIGPKKNRDLEIDLDTANKILVLGIPKNL
jgi:hypothetical protein